VAESKLYLASPLDFNDPFDALPNVILEGSSHKQRAYFRRLTRTYKPELSRPDRIKFAASLMNLPPEKKLTHLRQGLVDTARDMAVCSFAESLDEVLMWSHYAANHTGICLRFGTANSFFRSSLPLQITYSDKRPAYNAVDPGPPAGLIDLLLTKANFWSYEKEWRLVETKGSGTRSFPPTALEAIYFGCRTTEEHKRAIRVWIVERGMSLELFQGEAAADTFDLHFKRIE
jgi:hypothetical protein